jgi:hypothetical protein
MTNRLWYAATLAFMPACSGPVLDVGSGADGGANDDAMLSAASVTTWNGFFEDYTLPSGSSHVTLKLSIAPDGRVTGTGVLGDLPFLDPPTDPEVGYPPSLPDGQKDAVERFEFTISEGRMDGARLTFFFSLAELLARWCQLQTKTYPLITGDGVHHGYACIPNAPWGNIQGGSDCFWHDETTNADVPVDCGKLYLCQGHFCSCTPTSCTLDLTASPGGMQFDLHVVGATADGSVLGGLKTTSPVKVHLARE